RNNSNTACFQDFHFSKLCKSCGLTITFSNGMMYREEPKGPASESANLSCRPRRPVSPVSLPQLWQSAQRQENLRSQGRTTTAATSTAQLIQPWVRLLQEM